MPLLSIKTKNLIEKAAKSSVPPVNVVVTAKNTSVNGQKRGCYGFVKNLDTGSCVYFDTESSCYGPLVDKVLYRYAKNEKDYSSTGLANAYNHFCVQNELGENIISLLKQECGKEEGRIVC